MDIIWYHGHKCPCVFSNAESPDIYKICRRNKQSLDRHSLRRHSGKKANVRPFNDKDELVSKARETFHKWFKEKNNSMASSLKKSTRMKNANVKKTAKKIDALVSEFSEFRIQSTCEKIQLLITLCWQRIKNVPVKFQSCC